MDKNDPENRRVCRTEPLAWTQLVSYLAKFPRTEKFGVGIGFRDGLRNVILAYVWPKQEARSGGFCMIRIEDLGIILPFIVDLRADAALGVPIGVTAWVHTHPNLGLFLSGTDRTTFGNWAEVDPGMLAVVVDVFQGTRPTRAAFAPDFRETEIGDHDESPEPYRAFLERMTCELPELMLRKGRPLDAVITPFGGWTHPDGLASAPHGDVERPGEGLASGSSD